MDHNIIQFSSHRQLIVTGIKIKTMHLVSSETHNTSLLYMLWLYIYIHTAIATSASALEYEGLDPTEHEWINASTDADVDAIHRLLMVDPTLVNRKVIQLINT